MCSQIIYMYNLQWFLYHKTKLYFLLYKTTGCRKYLYCYEAGASQISIITCDNNVLYTTGFKVHILYWAYKMTLLIFLAIFKVKWLSYTLAYTVD